MGEMIVLNNKTRIIFLLLFSLILIIHIIPASAAGSCGPTMTWSINGNILSIIGYGEMTSHPWGDSYFTSIEISEGVTFICDSAFEGNRGLRSVVIPDSVETIGNRAFYGCGFYTMSAEITFSSQSRLQHIGSQAFGGYVKLYAEIGSNAAKLLGGFYYPGSDTLLHYWTDSNGVVYLQLENIGNAVGHYDIPEGVEQIGSTAFQSVSSITSVTIPNSVYKIGGYAFANSGITSITIPNSVTQIGESAFSNASNLESVVLSTEISSIPNNLFFGCKNLISITIPQNITSIGKASFYGCTSLTDVYFLTNLVTEIDDDAFLGCNAELCFHTLCETYPTVWAQAKGISVIKSDHNETVSEAIAPTETEAGYTEGSHCSLCGESIIIQKTIPALSDMAVLRLPSSIKTIEENAFEGLACQAIIIPNGCSTIGEKAFAENDNLLYVHIPASITTIADNAFEGCDNVTIFRDED